MSGGIFFGINIALKGMMAQQTSLNVVSHNIANANTPGYTRQRANLETSVPLSGLTQGAGQLGSGVEVAEIERIRDSFIDYQIRNESSKKGTWEGINDVLQQLETVFMEPSETGFNELLGEFWNSWQELSKSAANSPIRTTLKETTATLTDNIRHMYNQLTDIKSDIEENISINITEINSISTQLADLNEQIINISLSDDNPNDLLDQRDMLLEELSELGNVSITDIPKYDGKASGAVIVVFGGTTIVDENGANPLTSVSPTDGELAGLQKAASNNGVDTDTIQYYIDKLNTLAVGLAKAVNDIHSQGKALDESTGLDFFVFKDENGSVIDSDTIDWTNPSASNISAANIYLNPVIENDPAMIAAAQGDTGVTFKSTETLNSAQDSDGNTLTLEEQFGITDKFSFTLTGKDSKQYQAVDIDPSITTIDDLVEDINNNSTETGIIATFDHATNSFTLQTADVGEDAAITISDPDAFLANVLRLDFTEGDTYQGQDNLFMQGNGDTALAIAELQNMSFLYDPANGLLTVDNSGGTTLNDFYKDMIAELGVATQEAERMVENQDALVEQLQMRKESYSGVSLDEEMANMVRFQHAYQANARVISVMDELLDTIVNGLVG